MFSCSDADISIASIGLEPRSFVAGGSSFGCMVVMALISLFVFISFWYSGPFCLVISSFKSIHKMTFICFCSRLVRKILRSCVNISLGHVSIFWLRKYLECWAYTVCGAVIFVLHGLYADITHVDFPLFPR